MDVVELIDAMFWILYGNYIAGILEIPEKAESRMDVVAYALTMYNDMLYRDCILQIPEKAESLSDEQHRKNVMVALLLYSLPFPCEIWFHV